MEEKMNNNIQLQCKKLECVNAKTELHLRIKKTSLIYRVTVDYKHKHSVHGSINIFILNNNEEKKNKLT